MCSFYIIGFFVENHLLETSNLELIFLGNGWILFFGSIVNDVFFPHLGDGLLVDASS